MSSIVLVSYSKGRGTILYWSVTRVRGHSSIGQLDLDRGVATGGGGGDPGPGPDNANRMTGSGWREGEDVRLTFHFHLAGQSWMVGKY